MNEKTYHHGNLKNTLIETGIALLNEQGQEHFSLRKVAAKCGVSHAAPYSHFKSKEELIEAMQHHVTQQFTEVLQKTAEKYHDDLDIVLHLGNAYISFFMEHKQYFAFLYGKSGIQFDFTENGILNNTYPPCSIFKKATLELMEKIHFPEQNRSDTLIALLVLVHGITALLTTEQLNYKGDWKQLLYRSITSNVMFANYIEKEKRKEEKAHE